MDSPTVLRGRACGDELVFRARRAAKYRTAHYGGQRMRNLLEHRPTSQAIGDCAPEEAVKLCKCFEHDSRRRDRQAEDANILHDIAHMPALSALNWHGTTLRRCSRLTAAVLPPSRLEDGTGVSAPRTRRRQQAHKDGE